MTLENRGSHPITVIMNQSYGIRYQTTKPIPQTVSVVGRFSTIVVGSGDAIVILADF